MANDDPRITESTAGVRSRGLLLAEHGDARAFARVTTEAYQHVQRCYAEYSVGDEPGVPLEVEECSGGVRAEDAVHPAAVEAEQREASLQLTDVVTTLVGHGMEQGSLAENSARLDQRQPGL